MKKLLSLLAILALVAACGDAEPTDTTAPDTVDTTEAPADTSPPPDTTPDTTEAPDTTEPPEPDDPAENEIVIASFSFGPRITVSAGEEVTVRNDDTLAHTWTADDGEFDSGSISPGGTFAHTFDEPGTYSFACLFHPEMQGSLMVEG